MAVLELLGGVLTGLGSGSRPVRLGRGSGYERVAKRRTTPRPSP